MHYANKVLEVVTNASCHIEAANSRTADAEQQAKLALEQVQHMRVFMQAEIARQQAETAQQLAQQQAEELRQKEVLAAEVQRLQAEALQRRLLPIVFHEPSTEEVQRLQAEALQQRLLPIVFQEPSTEAGSVGVTSQSARIPTKGTEMIAEFSWHFIPLYCMW